jgi:hypothetical protein
VRLAASAKLHGHWSPSQLTVFTGADQLWVFDRKYYVLLIGMLFTWGVLFVNLIRARGPRRVFRSMPFQFFIMSAGGVMILPSTILIPGFLHSLVYVAERMSLGVAVCVCALLARARPRLFDRYAMAFLVALFFCFLWVDERALNGFEDRLRGAVATLDPGQRVVNVVDQPGLRVNAVTHMIDRVCIGHCYSYANYEPSTAQFRVRAVSPNPYVVSRYADSWALQTGTYSVKPEDEPLFAVDLAEPGQLAVKPLKSGTMSGGAYWEVLPHLLPAL